MISENVGYLLNYFASISGNYAYRNTSGSRFIQGIAEALKEKSHNTSVEDIIKEVSIIRSQDRYQEY